MADHPTVYKIVGVAPNRVWEGRMTGSPSDYRLCAWGKQSNVQFVIRFFPTRKGWGVLDIRRAFPRALASKKITIWRGHQRHDTYFPNEDAAVMWAMHHCGVEPAQ